MRFGESAEFLADLKRLERKYPRLRDDLAALNTGPPPRIDQVPGFGGRLLKVRVPSRDMQRGASGGFRLLLYVGGPEVDPKLWALALYPKAERADMGRDEIKRRLGRLFDFLRR